jgi:transcriptional regulator with XRE-family HTH domain/Zn-dependent peptidase ImmA (M78 family)
MAKTFVGSRVRQLRSERGFSQAALAQMLEISPSYLNQIEHDVRPLTVAVLLRITEVFGVDATFFASHDDTRLVAELREVMFDRDLDADVEPTEVADLVGAHPAIARAMVNLHRRYRITTAQLAEATEDRFNLNTEGSGTGSISMPHEEVRDYFYERQNYLGELDTAAEDLTARVRMHGGELRTELSRRLTEVHGVRIVRRIDLGDTVLHRYHPVSRTLEISTHLAAGQRAFKMAAELAYLEVGDLIEEMVTEGKFTSDESRRLARLGLANYFAAATVLPYRQFHDVSENFGYDIERLSAFYQVSYETICHRLSTMQRPSMRGVPFSFVRVDRAGNMSKRQSATGFHFSRSWCRLRRCPTGAATCGWHARSSGVRTGTDNPARPSPSDWVAKCATQIGWCTRAAWTCPRTTPPRSGRDAGSANGTTVRSGPSRRWGGPWTSTSTEARCRHTL